MSDNGTLDIGEAKRNAIGSRTLGPLDMRAISLFARGLFDQLPQKRAAATATDRERVERGKRFGVHPRAQHRYFGPGICRQGMRSPMGTIGQRNTESAAKHILQ